MLMFHNMRVRHTNIGIVTNQLALDDNFETLYQWILVDKFGNSLSKKDMKDESKGQIITLINSGGIASLFTADLKAKDSIVFIPNKNTLPWKPAQGHHMSCRTPQAPDWQALD